ncbi:hypothetical protein AQUCO_02700042v1 [Aquilegia coerulea]|uniref:F-box domain-containing protein n=1 Tax=Aquilegia coerulea TaxID=218851 RepID=A0A2G5D4Y5_AQUCA|nr:hypothetical protein AQUCO_02700042v1 [Aquilegia coerulea]
MATTSNTGEMTVVLLPDDVVFRILLWLPVASLLRFKSVCKSWLSLIESSCFIIQHYHHLHLPNNNLLYQEEEEENILVVTHPLLFQDQDPCFSVSVSLLSGNKFQMLQNFHLPHSSIKEGVHHVQILASCDGIVCIQYDHYRDVALLNPGTKQCRILPRSFPLPPEVEILQGERQGTNINGGFGFDVKSNDYKLVRILEVFRGSKILKLIERQVEVYSLNNNSWTTIEDVVLPTGIFILGSDLNAPFQNGIYCWLGRKLYSSEYGGMVRTWLTLLVSFDFSKCVFETMPLPDVYTVGEFNLRLALFKENVSCIEQPDCRLGEKYDCNTNIIILLVFRKKERLFARKETIRKMKKSCGCVILLLKNYNLYQCNLLNNISRLLSTRRV